jgi:hypothetical protein
MTDDTPDPDLQRIVEAMVPADDLAVAYGVLADLVRREHPGSLVDTVAEWGDATDDELAALGRTEELHGDT